MSSAAADAVDPRDPVQLDAVTVTGQSPAEDSTGRHSTTLRGPALRLRAGGTLGQALEDQPGVANASFGPGVGIPVIRGLTGNRVRLLQDGIGSHDAASVSPDHAVTLEPLLADSIAVVRGPATIRYGSGAIGGVVDVRDNRIPEAIPQRGVEGALEQRFDTNGDAWNSVFKLDGGSGQFAGHVDGFHRQRGNLEIPGAALDSDAIAAEFDLRPLASLRGFVPNTGTHGEGGTLGGAWLGERGSAGMAVNYMDQTYGIPPGGHGVGHRHAGQPASPLESVTIDLRQTRYDFKAEWLEPLPGFESATLRYGLVDYRHVEIENGRDFTTFTNAVGEGRFELNHAFTEAWSGTFGAHWLDRRFAAVGVEGYVPPVRVDAVGGFATQRFTLGRLVWELGWRSEWFVTDPEPDALRTGGLPPVRLPARLDYAAHSFALGATWNYRPSQSLALNLSRAQRAPDVQELLSLGPHLSTRTYDVGNVALSTETNNVAELTWAWREGAWQSRVGGFANLADDYIFLGRVPGFFYRLDEQQFRADCARLENCLPVFNYAQRDALLMGYEAEIQWAVPATRFGDVSLSLFSDYVRGRLTHQDGGDLPRLPPRRFGAELAWTHGRWDGALRYTQALAQRRSGLGEAPTPGYNLLNANLGYRYRYASGRELWLFARATNLLDEDIRNAASLLRGFTPEPGRSWQFGVRLAF